MSTLTWHPFCWSLLLLFWQVRIPKCRAGIAAAGCSRCRTDWTSAGASGWLSLPSQGEAWRCTSYYSRSSRPAQTTHQKKKKGEDTIKEQNVFKETDLQTAFRIVALMWRIVINQLCEALLIKCHSPVNPSPAKHLAFHSTPPRGS